MDYAYLNSGWDRRNGGFDDQAPSNWQGRNLITSRSPHEDRGSIHFLQGNAKNIDFLKPLLQRGWDAIVDFMWYPLKEFQARYDLFLRSMRQYLFLSSARVYAPSTSPIVETSPRLLDESDDQVFLSTGGYALDKAREEDLLFQDRRKNWTIVRPYITYNTERLQLGVLEKEYWLYRALHGKTILFHDFLAERWTTLSYGDDVAWLMLGLIGNTAALGEAFHIAPSEPIQWGKVLDLYLNVLTKYNHGVAPAVLRIKKTEQWERVMKNHYQVCYDRDSDRCFDNQKIFSIAGKPNEIMAPEEGLRRCLETFLGSEQVFRDFSLRAAAYMDKRAGERRASENLQSSKERLLYALWRTFPTNLCLCVWDLKAKLKAQ